MNTKSYSISGLHCQSCAELVKDELSELAGVKKVEVSSDLSTLTLSAESDQEPTIENINAALKEHGYAVS